MKKAILVGLIIVGLMFAGCKNPAGSGGNIVDNRFVGKWVSPGFDYGSLLEFIDSSHLAYFNGYWGWTATATYTFTDTVISMDVKAEEDGEILFSYKLRYEYILTGDHLDIMSYPGAVPADPIGLCTVYSKQ